MLVRLKIDFEHASRDWWERGGQDLWEGISEGFEDHAVLVDSQLAESWLVEAARIEGWDAGPDYAPHPVRLEPVDEDEIL
jgi:hypothetical protein